MEKAILKTLIYADIFDYPLTLREIHKWLVNRKASLRQVEKALSRLSKKEKVKSKKEYYFLHGRDGIVRKRLEKEKQSQVYFKKAKLAEWVFKLIPWVKLVGVSGGLAMENASQKDDIDLFIVTSKGRLWISRILMLGLLQLLGQRRKRGDLIKKAAGKICLNILLDEDSLEQVNKDIYLAHEVLQMKILWHREGIYSKYLEGNAWVFKFLPNWISTRGPASSISRRASSLDFRSLSPLARLLDRLELVARRFQLKVMGKPQGMERIKDGALYFHPQDIRMKVLETYNKRIKLADY